MKSRSVGTRARSRSLRRSGGRAGFTLIEALVALTVVLLFAATIGPFMFQARRITSDGDARVAAHALLRSLMSAPLDRASPGNITRQGETSGMAWRIRAEPILLDALPEPREPQWLPMRVIVSVSWGPEHMISAETIRLGRAQ